MAKKAKKRVGKTTPSGCPKCGGQWTKRSGLWVCRSCNHAYGSQNPWHPLVNSFFTGHVGVPRSDEDYMFSSDRHPTGRRDASLKFKR